MLLRPFVNQLSRQLPTRTLLVPTSTSSRLNFTTRFKMSDAAAASTQAPPANAAGDAPNLQKDPETGEMVSKS